MLNKLALSTATVALLLILTACQSTPNTPVIARADGTLETTGLGKTKTDAQTSALKSAKAQCGYKTPIVISDSTTYHGVMDEKLGRAVEQSVKIVGGVLGMGTPDIGRDDDYEYLIKFKCQ